MRDSTIYSLLMSMSPVLPNISRPHEYKVATGRRSKRFVFRNRDRELLAGAKYAALAACILASNTTLLSFLVNSLGMNKFAQSRLRKSRSFL
jgi:hypothetical protein